MGCLHTDTDICECCLVQMLLAMELEDDPFEDLILPEEVLQ
jgi:hypothetical protein